MNTTPDTVSKETARELFLDVLSKQWAELVREDSATPAAVLEKRAEIMKGLPELARYSTETRTHLAYDKQTDAGTKEMKAKTGKLLARWLAPLNLKESELHKIAQHFVSLSPVPAADEQPGQAWNKPLVMEGLKGDYIELHHGEDSGSCMAPCANGEYSPEDAKNRRGSWTDLEQHCYEVPNPHKLPAIDHDHENERGPQTLIFQNVPHRIMQGKDKQNTAIRTFLWPVQTATGNSYHLDRGYPSNPMIRAFLVDFAEARGWTAYDETGSGCHNSEELPALRHHLATAPNFYSDSLPWMDSLNANDEGADHIETPRFSGNEVNARETGGTWQEGMCCEGCGDHVTEDDQCYDEDSGETLCFDCYNERYIACDQCGTSHNRNNSIEIAGNNYCDHECVSEAGYYCCEYCGDMEPEADGYHTDQGFYCCKDCAESNGILFCNECGDMIENEGDSIEHNGKDYCSEYCAKNAGLLSCEYCAEWYEDGTGTDNTEAADYCSDSCAENDDMQACEDCGTYTPAESIEDNADTLPEGETVETCRDCCGTRQRIAGMLNTGRSMTQNTTTGGNDTMKKTTPQKTAQVARMAGALGFYVFNMAGFLDCDIAESRTEAGARAKAYRAGYTKTTNKNQQPAPQVAA